MKSEIKPIIKLKIAVKLVEFLFAGSTLFELYTRRMESIQSREAPTIKNMFI